MRVEDEDTVSREMRMVGRGRRSGKFYTQKNSLESLILNQMLNTVSKQGCSSTGLMYHTIEIKSMNTAHCSGNLPELS